MRRLRRKIYIDEDPGFTQFWLAAGNTGLQLDGHDFYFTIGENIGSASCPIPTCGIHWRPMRPIVVLDQWPVLRTSARNPFTTIACWRGPYGPVQHTGKTYGLKVHEFRKFIELPQRTQQTFELALEIHPADSKDLNLLQEHGWHVVDPRVVAPDPDSFRHYIQSSGAEFSVAKGIYVETDSGWFSDRTARYLASGKPALVQETGFSRNILAGEGLVPFRTVEEAIAGAERIVLNYDRHCQAARRLAEEYFDSDIVLSQLLREVGIRASRLFSFSYAGNTSDRLCGAEDQLFTVDTAVAAIGRLHQRAGKHQEYQVPSGQHHGFGSMVGGAVGSYHVRRRSSAVLWPGLYSFVSISQIAAVFWRREPPAGG